jgi:TetR/AcrR family acrAB operon transcriptional repressor
MDHSEDLHMRRTKEQAAQTRIDILRVAQELFLENEYESVSLDQIAIAAGLTRGAVSWHFGNREGLLYAIREEMRLPMEQLAEALSAYPLETPVDGLSEAVFETFRSLDADPRQGKLLRILSHLDTLEVLKGDEKGVRFTETLFHSLRSIFEAIDKSSGLSPPWSPHSAATAFSILLRGLIGDWANSDGKQRLLPDANDISQTILQSFQRRST